MLGWLLVMLITWVKLGWLLIKWIRLGYVKLTCGYVSYMG